LLVAVEEHLEEVGSVVLVALGGMVTLSPEDGIEARVGGVVGAGFTDRFELAVELSWPVAVAVAQHGVVVLGGEAGHV
jgi:hypothetical protein